MQCRENVQHDMNNNVMWKMNAKNEYKKHNNTTWTMNVDDMDTDDNMDNANSNTMQHE